MRAPPRLRGGLGTRLTLLIAGLFVFAAGIVALLESRLGLSPWDVLHQGIARHTPLSFGAANVAVSVVVVGIAWALGARVGIGTLANALLVGAFVQLLTSLGPVADLAHASVEVRIGLLFAGLLLMGAGTGLYLGADLGAGPRDSLMVVGARRTPLRIGVVRGLLEVLALAAGVVLGGTVGVGTVAFALGIGPAVELSFWLLERSPLAKPAPAVLARVPAARDGGAISHRPRLVGINHVALEVTDVAEAVAFWRQLFEIELQPGEPGAAFIDLGDQFLALMEAGSPAEDLEHHFGLVVDDKEGTRQALLAAGAEVLPGPRLDFRDPFGNRIQVVQYDQIQFSKNQTVLRAMGLQLAKTPAALAELRAKGISVPMAAERARS